MTFRSGFFNRAMSAAIALMVVCASFVVIMATPSSEAAFPAMSEGEKWALKGEKDLSLSYSSFNDLISIGNSDNWLRNATIKGAGFSGYVGSAAVFEVVTVTDSEYVIRMTAAQNLSLAAMLSIEGEMALPGSYISEWYSSSLNPDNLKNMSEAPTMKGPFGFDATIVIGANETVTFHLDKDTMAIRSLEMYMSAYARGHVEVNNLPNTTTYWDSVNDIDLFNITSYESFKSNISLDLNLSGIMAFEPSLKIVKDPMVDGDTWTQDTYVNATFNWDGIFDMTGLPANITDMLFGSEQAEVGITGFPIDLAAIYNPGSGGPQIDNGTLEVQAGTIDPEFTNRVSKMVDGTAFGSILVNEIWINLGGSSDYVSFLYYPEKGYIVGAKIMMPLMGGMSMTLTMDSVPVSEGQKMVESITDQVKKDLPYDVVNSAAAADKGLGIPLDLLIILLVVVTSLVVMLSYVFIKVHRVKPKE